VGLELLEQWPDIDTVVVPVGGGGLAAGIAVAMRTHHPDVRVVGIQAAGADAAAQALECGERVTLERCRTFADGIAVSQIGELPFALLKKHEVPILRVSDAEIGTAVLALCQTAKLVVEPAGATAAAAAIFHADRLGGAERIAVVLSGANVTTDCLVETLLAHRQELPRHD
jgi:threonine dehydratase